MSLKTHSLTERLLLQEKYNQAADYLSQTKETAKEKAGQAQETAQVCC